MQTRRDPPPGTVYPPSGPGVQVRRRVPGPPASRSAPLHRTGDAVWVCPGDPGRCRPVPRSSSHPLTARRRRADPSAAGTPPLTSARRPALEATAALRAHRQASGERRRRRSGGETIPAPPAPPRPRRPGHSPRRHSQTAPIVRPPPRPAPLRPAGGHPPPPLGRGPLARVAAAGLGRSGAGPSPSPPPRHSGAGLAPPGAVRAEVEPAWPGWPRGWTSSRHGGMAPARVMGPDGTLATTARALRSHRWR